MIKTKEMFLNREKETKKVG